MSRHRHRRHQRRWHGIGIIFAAICRIIQIGVLVYGIGHIVLCIIDMVNANARAAATPYFTLDGWIAYNAFSNVLGIAIVMIIVIVIFQVIYKYMKEKYYW